MLAHKQASNHTSPTGEEQQLHHETMTPASEALTSDQIRAFKEAFDLFDNNGGGTIDSAELKDTLDSVGIEIEQEDIEEVMMQLDEDGNGEIDFEEFLNLMTNTEMFLEAFARKKNSDETDPSHPCRDVLLFDALTEFMKKSALKAADEIVGYYAKKYKKVVKTYNMNKGAHVVGHYADGARLIGLTEKQIYRELKRLRMYSNFTKDERNSPYAQPLHLALLKTSRPKSIRPPKRVNSARSCNSSNNSAKIAPTTRLQERQHKADRERAQRALRRVSMTGIQRSAHTKRVTQKRESKKHRQSRPCDKQRESVIREEKKPPQSVMRQLEERGPPKATPVVQSQAPAPISTAMGIPMPISDASAMDREAMDFVKSTMDTADNSPTPSDAIARDSNRQSKQRRSTCMGQPPAVREQSAISKTMSSILSQHVQQKNALKASESDIGDLNPLVGKRTGKIRITMIRSKMNTIERCKSGKVASEQTLKNRPQMRCSTAPEKRPSEILPTMHKPGWHIQRTRTINIHMPLQYKWSRVPVCKLPMLRTAVKVKEKEFIKDKEKQKLLNTKQLFRGLDTRAAAYTPPLMHQFLAASAAYSCATPDNRIRIEVDDLQIIQSKDAKLRFDQESRQSKRGGGDGRSLMKQKMREYQSQNKGCDIIRS